ncbi:MAG: GAF domain-containing protein [Candidatus Rokubacteria bacterium]|nr:GAF domain-containing protein [Candidatus Rokubacteria bacterium]
MPDKPRILVVDDELGVRESLRMMLRGACRVETVESGVAALQLLPTFRPDLVFLDIKMPTMDGLEVLQQIKAHDATIEVVMITAYASLQTLRQAVTDGAFEYLIKPFSRRDLEETVRRALERRGGKPAAQDPVWIQGPSGDRQRQSRTADLLTFTEKGHRFDALARLAQAVTSSLALPEVLERVAQAAIDLHPDSASRIWVVEGGRLALRSEAGVLGPPRSGRRIELAFGEGLTGHVAAARQPLVLEDVLADPRAVNAEWIRQEGCASLVSLPLVVRAQLVGVLSLFTRHPYRFSPGELEILTSFGSQAAIAIENARLFGEAQRRERAAESLAEVGRLISQSLDLGEVAQRIADSVRVLLGTRVSALFRLEPESGTLVALAVSGDAGLPGDQPLVLSPGTGLGALALRERRPVVTRDLISDCQIVLTPEARARIEPTPFHAALAVPLLVKDAAIGALVVRDTTGRVFTAEEIRVAQAFADHAAVALENTWLHRETVRRLADQAALLRLSQAVLLAPGTQEILDASVGVAAEVFGVDLCGVLLPDEEDQVLRLVAGVGWNPGVVGTVRVETGLHSPAGYALRLNAPVIVEELATESRFSVPSVLRDHGVVSSMVVPMLAGDTIIGVMGAHGRRPRRFTAEEVRLFTLIANQTAVALERARLLEEIRRQHQEAVALEAVAREVTSSLDRREVFQRIVERARGLCGGDLAFLAPCDRETGTATIVAVAGARTDALLAVTITPGRGTGGRVLETGEPFTTTDYLHDPRISQDYAAAAAGEGFVAQAVVPLRFGKAITGLLWVVNRDARPFTPRDLAVLTKLADQAAIALENTRLYGDLRAALGEIEVTQQRVIQGERLRALGEMAAGVAHDFNNALAAIVGRVRLLLDRPHEPELERQLRVIEKAARDAAQTVRRIQEFARMRRARPVQAVDLTQVVDEVVDLTRSRWKDEAQARGLAYDIRVEAAPLPPVAGDPSELREALTNLVLNALDAMSDGGQVTLKTAAETGQVSCVVADSGIGMSEEVRRRVFDPFFTTKGEKGSGLGLSVVYGIITRHGGEIEVQSREGCGSAFTIRLPVGQEIPAASDKTLPLKPPRSAKILVIDDEPEVREVLDELLASQGHAVVACADGRSGLTALEDGRFDLVITDLAMPEVTGWQVASAVKFRHPETPVALLTGYGDRIDPEEARTKGVDFLLSKPFGLEDVETTVAQALWSHDRERVSGPSPRLTPPAPAK